MADEIRRHRKPATPHGIAGLRDTEQLEKLTTTAKKREQAETAEKSGGGLGDNSASRHQIVESKRSRRTGVPSLDRDGGRGEVRETQ